MLSIKLQAQACLYLFFAAFLTSLSVYANELGVFAIVEPDIDVVVHQDSIELEPEADGRSFKGRFSFDVFSNQPSVGVTFTFTDLYLKGRLSAPSIPVNRDQLVSIRSLVQGQEQKVGFTPFTSTFKGMRSHETQRHVLGYYPDGVQDSFTVELNWRSAGNRLKAGKYQGVIYMDVISLAE